MSKVKVCLVRAGEEPILVEIENDLDGIRSAIGCDTIDAVPLGCGFTAWIDDEGALTGKPFNSCRFVGDYFIAADEGDEIGSMTPEQFEQAKNYWRAFKDVPHPGLGMEFVPLDSMEQALEIMQSNSRSRDEEFRWAQDRARQG